MSEIELKTCPFCGGEAIYSDKKVRIICKRCEAQIQGVRILRNVPNYKNYLSGLWNRRAAK